MEFFSRYFNSVKAQIAGLTVSQKLLIGLLIVVMVATIFFTVTLSAKPEMVVLIAQPMTAEDINHAEMYLKGKFEYTVDGDKIMVPADKAYAIRGELAAAQALPKDLTTAFDSMIRESSFLSTDGMTNRQWNHAKEQTLTQMLNCFPGVEYSAVLISTGERAALGRDGTPSSATVQVKMKNNDPLSNNQLNAIVDMVRGAVSGLQRDNITVTDGQRSYHVGSDVDALPTSLLEYKKTIEDDLSRKLNVMFSEIGNVKIAVNVVPDMSQHKVTRTEYDPKVVKATRSESTRETASNEGSAPTGEPGVRPNVAAVADSGSTGRKSSQTSSDSLVQNDNYVNQTLDESVVPAATEIKQLTASISLPRSYFVSVYRRATHDQAADPTDDKLQPTIDLLLQQAQKRAKNAIGAKTDDQVRVDWFDDMIAMPQVNIAGAGGAVASGSMGGMISQYAKQAVLAAVALGVLGMMLMMVRKAVPAAAGADIDPNVFFGNGAAGGGGKRRGKNGQPQDMDVGDDVYGEANEGEAVLTGIELDDETLQSRKMVDEVSVMIKENPENAAALIKRWMTKGK